MAKFSRTLASVTVPTTVSIDVGCGLKNGNQWKYVFNGLGKVRATRTGTVFINVGCTTSKCTGAPRGTGGSTTFNPATQSNSPSTLNGQEWCTYRAAEFWKQMTGSYLGWGGDAGAWDDNAPGLRWAVRSWPEPDSLMIWQPPFGWVGHVGYVADVRVSAGKTQVKIYDRNFDGQSYNGKIYDRNGVWQGIPGGARFIRVPPRFTGYNR